MCWSALPDHINEPKEWNGKDDDDHWYTKWRKAVKGYMAFGPRDHHWYHRFRKYPITLLAFFGKGDNRWENDLIAVRAPGKAVYFHRPSGGFYLSRVQYFCRWHVQLQWPLFFCFHFYWKANDVASYPVRSKLKGWMGYVGFKRDSDQVYWAGLYLGKSFK